jgi:hypothetical protein
VPPELQREMWLLVALVGAFLGIYVGCETGFGAFITSYMVVALRRPEAEGQLLTGAYWGAITVGRFAAIFIAMRFKPRDYLGVSQAGCVVASVLLLAFAGSASAVWFFGCVFGLFMACVFPTAIAYAETVFPVQGKHVAIFVVGSATGEMLLPFIISTLFGGNVDTTTGEVAASGGGGAGAGSGTAGPIVMMWIVCVATCLNMGVYFLLVKRGAALSAAIAAAAGRAAEGGGGGGGGDGGGKKPVAAERLA